MKLKLSRQLRTTDILLLKIQGWLMIISATSLGLHKNVKKFYNDILQYESFEVLERN